MIRVAPSIRSLLVVLSLAATIPAHATGTTLLSFETEPVAPNEKLWGWNATVARVKTKATDGKYSVRMDVAPNVTGFASYEKTSLWDFSNKGVLLADITNPGTETVSVKMIVEDNTGKTLTIEVPVPPGATAHPCLMMSDRRQPSAFGLRDLPRVASEARMVRVESWNDAHPNLAAIKRIHLAIRATDKAQAIYFDNYRTTPYVNLDAFLSGWIDKYGQNARADWAGKINTNNDLAAAKEDEEAQLAATSRPATYDEYGGDLTHAGIKGTGYFTVQKQKKGGWSFYTPKGSRFWSFGVNGVGCGQIGSTIEGRESMFQWLPSVANGGTGALTNVVVNGRPETALSFGRLNIDRKYGEGHRDDYRARLVERMQKWGLNTIGNFSESYFTQDAKIPVTPGVSTNGTLKIAVPLGGNSNMISDPYDPLYPTKLAANTWVMQPKNPMVVGYFVDNILPFSSPYSRNQQVALGLAVLELNATTSPAKKAMVDSLKAEYSSITALNAGWNTSFGSWDSLAAGYTLANRSDGNLVSTPMYNDLREYMKAFARRYFQLTRDVLKVADPNHLYLGCRIDAPDEDIVRIMADYADVASINVYQNDVTAGQWSFLKNIDRPLLISEYGFNSYERGMPGLFVECASDVDKANAYKAYVKGCLKVPSIVGAHIFQFTDQNPHGDSWNMENCNHGFVDITDTPYDYMVSATRELADSIYSLRK
ncbi:beta-galactosidase [soil metagenome]